MSKTLTHLGNALIRVGRRLAPDGAVQSRDATGQVNFIAPDGTTGRVRFDADRVNLMITGTYDDALAGRRIELGGLA